MVSIASNIMWLVNFNNVNRHNKFGDTQTKIDNIIVKSFTFHKDTLRYKKIALTHFCDEWLNSAEFSHPDAHRLTWRDLAQRQTDARLSLMYKLVYNLILIEAINMINYKEISSIYNMSWQIRSIMICHSSFIQSKTDISYPEPC